MRSYIIEEKRKEADRVDYWKIKNPDFAAMEVLYNVIGYLKASGETVSTKEVLDYIHKQKAAKTARLDERFPERKGPEE